MVEIGTQFVMCYTQFVMLLYDCVKGTLELKHGVISSSTQILHISILQSSRDFSTSAITL